MNNDSYFINSFIDKMTETMMRIDSDYDEKEVRETIKELIEEQGANPRVTLDNNYTGERRETTLLSVFDWAIDRKPILCGNATFYKNQHEAMNPIAKMLEDFLAQRKAYKKQMFQVEDSTSSKYRDLDRQQANEKINVNS
jgi:hypothetical protein